MTADKHRIPGDSDKHLADWRFNDAEGDSLNIEESVNGTLTAHAVAGGDNASLGMQLTQPPAELYAQALSDNLVDGFDADIYHHSYFDDDKWRFTITESGNSNTDLYTTGDFESITKVADSIFGSGSDDMRVGDHAVLPDGRFAVYVARNGSTIEIWTGTDLTSLTNQGTLFNYQADPGVILAPDGTVHLIPEADETGDKANVMKHYTTPWDDLFSTTTQSDALDVSALDWKTGDADIVRLGGRYFMFLDRFVDGSGGPYRAAVAESDDLYNWRITHDRLTSIGGGDLAVTKNGGSLYGITEQSGSIVGASTTLISWEIYPQSYSAIERARSLSYEYNFTADSIDGLEPPDTSGSGSVGLVSASDGTALEAATGTTSGSHARITKKLLSPWAETSWRNVRVWNAYVELLDQNDEIYIVMGDVTASSKTNEHVGFFCQGGALGRTVADGSNQTKTGSGIPDNGTGYYKFGVRYYPGDRVEYRVNNELEATETANLPTQTSTNYAAQPFTVLAQNATTTDRSIRVHKVEMGQEPTSLI